MTKSKLKILMCSEASFLSSGFGTYAKEILSRLHATNKYEIAEFASYGMVNDPRDKDISWKYYANAVRDNDPRHQEYMSRPDNQFGRWRFEKVLLDFQPDICIDVRDYWMSSYQAISPLRKYFHWILMPTVDSAPQQDEWIDTFLSADAIFTYSDWGAEVLKQQSSGKINYINTTSPGVDLQIFKPLNNKENIKKNLGLPEDSIILGSVMRNQKRKLFPELMISFRKVLDILETENYDLGKKLYLYLHTSYPDMGWDLPELLKDNRISNKVFFTYACRKCSHIDASVYVGPTRICPKCLNKTMMMPSVTNGIANNKLSEIYNIFDLYIQYAICLGKDEPIKIQRDGIIQWVPISQTKIGDKAWTHKNRWKTISNVWKNLPKSHDKKVLKVSIHSDYETLLATENHEFPAYTLKELTIKHRNVKENIGYYLYNKKPLPEPGRYELKDLKPGDMLYYPIDDTVIDIDKIDISAEIDCSNYLVLDSFIETSPNYAYPRYINIDNEFCKFIGLFAADGSWENNKTARIKITSHIKEYDNHHIATNTIQKLSSLNNIKAERIYHNRAAKDDALCSTIHTNLFARWFSKHENKKLPDWVMYLPSNKQKMILQGLFMGDAHYIQHRNTSIYCTISSTLADQIKHILRRLRISFNARISHKKGNRKPQYRFEVPGNIKNGEFLNNRIRNTRNTYYQNQHLIQIKNIIKSDYNDSVWCVTVEDDHTITTKLGVSFNCEGFGMPQVEASACGVPVATINYSAMVDIINKLDAIAIQPKTYFKELETKAIRVYPDNNQLSNEIIKFISQSSENIEKQKKKVRELTEQHYDWDLIAKKWEAYLDRLSETYRSNWHSPAQYITEKLPDISDLSEKDILITLEHFCHKAFKDKHKISSMRFLSMLQYAFYGFSVNGTNIQNYNYNDILESIKIEIQNINHSEHARVNKIKFNDDFIQYAHIKSNT